jgi:hypothetical protein
LVRPSRYGPQMRGLGVAAVALGAMALLPACSPVDTGGIGMTDERVPVIEDCDTFLTRVEVVDAAAGRPVWAAHIPPEVAQEHGGDAPVELGLLPSDRWVEDTPLALAPRPTTWVFSVESELGRRDSIRVDDGALEPGLIYRPGHDLVSRDEFFGDGCLDVGINPSDLLAVIAVGAGCLVVVVGTRRSRRTKVQAFTPEAITPGGPPPRDRG